MKAESGKTLSDLVALYIGQVCPVEKAFKSGFLPHRLSLVRPVIAIDSGLFFHGFILKVLTSNEFRKSMFSRKIRLE